MIFTTLPVPGDPNTRATQDRRCLQVSGGNNRSLWDSVSTGDVMSDFVGDGLALKVSGLVQIVSASSGHQVLCPSLQDRDVVPGLVGEDDYR
jgi:hypothetical protein